MHLADVDQGEYGCPPCTGYLKLGTARMSAKSSKQRNDWRWEGQESPIFQRFKNYHLYHAVWSNATSAQVARSPCWCWPWTLFRGGCGLKTLRSLGRLTDLCRSRAACPPDGFVDDVFICQLVNYTCFICATQHFPLRVTSWNKWTCQV